jgi:hypothetical protein
MKRSGKEVAVVYSSYCSDIFFERLTKTKLNLKIDDVPAEIRIEQLPNTSLERCYYTCLLGFFFCNIA